MDDKDLEPDEMKDEMMEKYLYIGIKDLSLENNKYRKLYFAF
ncbi:MULTISPECIES: hypothetical protein [Streptococcus]|nr:hypothetical protein [Streptococcus acidominimus]